MWIYWIVFILVSLSAFWQRQIRASSLSIRPSRPVNIFWFCLLVVIIGFRHEVGADWESYLNHIDIASHQNFSEALSYNDPGYHILNWITARIGGEVYFVNIVCGALFSFGLLRFCGSLPRPMLALVVAVPYLVIVVAMGYTRQGVAIGLAMLGLLALLNGRLLIFLLWIALAAAFHKSAVILVPLGIFSGSGRLWLKLIGVALTVTVLSALFTQEVSETIRTRYVETGLDSSGAIIRISLNALPAIMFLIWRKHFVMFDYERSFWTWLSILAISFLGLLLATPSTTVIDRLALYTFPLQLMVWSYFPDVIDKARQWSTLWVAAIVAYSAITLFVWLAFANHSFAWVPYKFYPLIWLES